MRAFFGSLSKSLFSLSSEAKISCGRTHVGWGNRALIPVKDNRDGLSEPISCCAFFLLVAVALEVCGTMLLPVSRNFTRLLPTLSHRELRGLPLLPDLRPE